MDGYQIETSLLAGSNAGLFRAGPQGWRRVGPAAPVVGIIADATRIIVAMEDHGVAVIDRASGNRRESGPLPLAIVSLAFDPINPGCLYAGTKPAGVMRSTDGGASWQILKNFAELPGTEKWEIPERDVTKTVSSVATGEGAAAWAVRIHPARPQRIVVGVEVGGLVVSEDGGDSWTILGIGESPDPHDIVIHPLDPDRVIVSTGFSRFTDQPGVFTYSSMGGVYLSGDGARSFRNVWGGPYEPQYTRIMSCDAVPPHAVTVCARSSYVQMDNPNFEKRADLRQSRDGGETWTSLATGEHARFGEEYSAVTADPRHPGDVFVATERGRVFHVEAETRRWTELDRLDGRVNALLAL